MTTFILAFNDDPVPGAFRVAVKDAIDVEGVPTTVGCAAIADTAEPAARDAACLAGIRAPGSGAQIVGKANLHELCFGITGINPWYGTPVNPLDPTLIPGGSSSGSAVAVASGAADIGLGTDTGGSVRIPAACCGIVGLKTTWGRISLTGVWPLSPSLDTVGPLARDVAGIERGMALLEPGFARAAAPARSIGRLRVPGIDAAVDAAVDDALRAAGYVPEAVELPGWDDTSGAFLTIITAEAWQSNRAIVERARHRIGADALALLDLGASVTGDQLAEARAKQEAWAAAVAEVLDEVDVIALPTLSLPPPPLDDADRALRTVRLTPQANLARVPAISVPVPMAGALPGSLQLIGPHRGEELLVATAAAIERGVGLLHT